MNAESVKQKVDDFIAEKRYWLDVSPQKEAHALAWTHHVVGQLNIQLAEQADYLEELMGLTNDQRDILYMLAKKITDDTLKDQIITKRFRFKDSPSCVTFFKCFLALDEEKNQLKHFYSYNCSTFIRPQPLPFLIQLSNQLKKSFLSFQLLPTELDYLNAPIIQLLDNRVTVDYCDPRYRSASKDIFQVLQQGQRLDLHLPASQTSEEQHIRFVRVGSLTLESHPGYHIFALLDQKNFQKPRGNEPGEDLVTGQAAI